MILRRTIPAVPGAIVALVGGTALVFLAGIPVETVGSRFGGIPAGFPAPHLPVFEAGSFPR